MDLVWELRVAYRFCRYQVKGNGTDVFRCRFLSGRCPGQSSYSGFFIQTSMRAMHAQITKRVIQGPVGLGRCSKDLTNTSTPAQNKAGINEVARMAMLVDMRDARSLGVSAFDMGYLVS